jgi:hypothetical protein
MKIKLLSIALLPLLIYSCGSGEESQEAEAEGSQVEAVEEVVEEIELKGAAAELKEGQGVYFVSPEDGAELSSPVVVEFGVEGMDVEPAGSLSLDKGHHHIVINASFIERAVVVPADETHIHYGKGQLSDSLNLEPGEYTLTMQFADGLHNSYGEQMSSTINITVK